MTSMRMNFSGDVRKPTTKDIGGKPAIEFQLMKKNYAPAGQEATFTWIRVTVFDCKPWQVKQCEEGKFVAGSGEFTLRRNSLFVFRFRRYAHRGDCGRRAHSQTRTTRPCAVARCR